jgi:hypothetical protein
MLYIVENIKGKYLNFSCADDTKPIRENEINLLLENKAKGTEKLLEGKENNFLPSIQDDQLQSDCRVGINKGPV